MKLSVAQQLHEDNLLDRAYLMRNPADRSQWFITLSLTSGKRYLLADENDDVIADSDIENLLIVLKSLGFHTAKISW